MKIREGNLGLEHEAQRIGGLGQGKQKKARGGVLGAEGEALDTSNLELSKEIQATLSPEVISEERRLKLEALKERIKEGKYFRSSEEIAQALEREITEEILLAGSEASKP